MPLNEYEDTLRRLLRRAVESTGCQLILGTPYYIEPDRLDPVRAAMDRYGAAVRAIASDFGALLVDTQAAFDAVLAATPATDWADDRVHPCLPGHAVLARAYLRAGWHLHAGRSRHIETLSGLRSQRYPVDTLDEPRPRVPSGSTPMAWSPRW